MVGDSKHTELSVIHMTWLRFLVFSHRNGRATQRPAGSDDGSGLGAQSADAHRKQVMMGCPELGHIVLMIAAPVDAVSTEDKRSLSLFVVR